jgi:hypothetical protein
MRYLITIFLMLTAWVLPQVASATSTGGSSCAKGGVFRISGAPVSAEGGAGAGLCHSSISIPAGPATDGRLARVTAYWPSEGDYYTRHGVASTGVKLHEGHCAVDPNIIPYGSVVAIAGVGTYLAVDTGTAVIERKAAREAGQNSAQRNALVIDLFFESRAAGEAFAASAAKWAAVSWWTPGVKTKSAKEARGLFADEDWQKIESKQL